MTLADLVTLPFMQRALLAALLVGLGAPAIGFFVVQRQLSMIGDGLSHIALGGVGLALLTGTSPYAVSVLICVVAAIGLELLRTRSQVANDLALAILFYGGLAVGVLTASVAGKGTGGLSSFLFGSITSLTDHDVWLMAGLALANIVATIWAFRALAAVSIDEDYAHIQGLPVRLINILILILAALTVSLSIRTVGALLIGALMVIPVGAAQGLQWGLNRTFYTSIGIGVLSAIVGVLISAWIDASPGAAIILVAITVFTLTNLVVPAFRRLQ